MPAPVAITFCVLIGWPILKIVTAYLSSRIWKSQELLRTQLKRDFVGGNTTGYNELIIECEFEAGKGGLLNFLLPIIAFFGGIFAVAMIAKRQALVASKDGAMRLEREILARRYPRDASASIDNLLNDWRFRKMRDQAFDLELLRFPIASALTILALIPAIVVYSIFSGLHTSVTRIGKVMIEASQTVLGSFFAFSSRFPCN